MRVAMVTPQFYPHTGGTATHVAEVGSRLATRGFDVSVLTTDPLGSMVPREPYRDMTIHRYPARPKQRDYYFSPALGRAIRGDKFDVVHVQGIHNLLAPLALAAANRVQVPCVVTFHTGGHSSRLRSGLRSAQWRALRPFLAKTRTMIAVCEYEVDLFSRALGLPASRFRVIRNGANPLPDTPVVLPESLRGEPLILSIGRLERYKGHHRVIASMPAVLRAAPGARLVVVGSGPYRAHLQTLVDRLGLRAAVEFVAFGPAQRHELGALVRRSDVVALLSEYEANPIAIMEALAAGTDVVAADTTGLSELGREGLARLVPLGACPDEVSRALIAAAAERCWADQRPQLPTWDDCTDELVTVYKEARIEGRA